MYEHKKQPVASKATYYQRVLNNVFVALLIIAICLSIGVAGYHYIANVPWIDALHNASMILSGMGPVVEIKNDSGKIFSSAYALFSGLVFISIAGFILAPAIHRIFHRLNHEPHEQ
jgi:putative Mn2+ efflux pump MntP